VSGFTLMPRALLAHPALNGRKEVFSRHAAFWWLVAEASWEERSIAVLGKPLRLSRGQLSFSTRFLAQAWRWTEPRVRRFLDRLSSDALIDAGSDAGQTLITICNYDQYAARNAATDAPSGAPSVEQRRKLESKNQLEEEEEGLGSAPADPSADPFGGQLIPVRAEPPAQCELPTASPIVPAEAVQISNAFKASVEEAWPTHEHMPTTTDRFDASRWLQAGAAAGISPAEMVELCAEVFGKAHIRRARQYAGPVRTLAFHDQRIADAIERRTRPMPEAERVGAGREGRDKNLNMSQITPLQLIRLRQAQRERGVS
jgi:hypothetical protein